METDPVAADRVDAWPVVAPHVVRPAPRPLTGPTVLLDDGWRTAVAERLARLAGDPDGVRVRDAEDPDDRGLLAALGAAVALVRREAPAAEPALSSAARAHLRGVQGWRHAADLVTLVQPADLVVLRADGGGTARAELLAVALPSGWAPRHRAGADLARLHAPVAEGGRLLSASGALSAALLLKGPFTMSVWGVQRHAGLAHDPSAPGGLPAPDPGGGWWLRVERQVTTPLPALGRALFWIRPSLLPVASLPAERRHGLAAAVRSLSPSSLAYKGLGDGLDADLLAALR